MKQRLILLLGMLICVSNFCIILKCESAQPVGEPNNGQAIQQSSPTDLEIQQMAVNTVAQMATNLINIGVNPNNPQHVGAQVISLLGSFVNFVTFAMRHPEILELIEDEDFKEVMRSCLEKKFKESLLQEMSFVSE